MSIEEIQEIKKSLARIELAIIGDSEMEVKGIVEKVKDLETHKAAIEKWKNKLQGAVWIGTPIMLLIYEILKSYFTK